MPDIMPVSMQDILHCRKSDLREQKIIWQNENQTQEKAAVTTDRCLMLVLQIKPSVQTALKLKERYS